MSDTGHIVVVAAGFALWNGGKCVAAARWGDVRRMHARRGTTESGAVRVVTELVDGSALEMSEDAPGFDKFIARAAEVLPGFPPFAQWHPAIVLGDASAEPVVLYQRRELGARRS